MQQGQFVKLDHNGAVSTLTIDRQDRLNALNRNVIAEIYTAVRALSERAETRCVIVTGAGTKAFVAGADIGEMMEMTPVQAAELSEKGQAAFRDLAALPVPTIAMVNGYALGGGCELALSCDLIYASATAQFGQPEAKLGVIPGFGGTYRLVERVGAAKAKELVFTGALIDAPEAKRIGLADDVFLASELEAQVRERAKVIALMAPGALRAFKELLYRASMESLTSTMSREAQAFGRCFTNPDQREGMRAFLDKRPPKFNG